jgi:hypothetical protein
VWSFRDPEVQELRHAAGGHQRVGGLGVSMEDEVLLCVRDGQADRNEEPQAHLDVERAGVAPLTGRGEPQRAMIPAKHVVRMVRCSHRQPPSGGSHVIRMPRLTSLPALASTFAVTALGCTADATPSAPEIAVDTAVLAAARSADRCVNVDTEIDATLGLWMLDGEPVGGGVPLQVELGGISGWIASLLETPTKPPQGRSGTVHWELTHFFFTTAPQVVDLGGGVSVQAIDTGDLGDWFMTDDSAVCADAGGGPLVCRVNDRMPIVAGGGIFTDAGGYLHNHGWITVTDPATGSGTGDFHARGRICGNGVGG